jgi:uncharacterized protein (UPF0276 family)
MDNGEFSKPVVGLLYNPAAPYVLDYAGELIEYLEVIPDRLWYDFGPDDAANGRFHRVHAGIEILKRYVDGRVVAGHGIGLSLPSAMPIDQAMVDEVAATSADLGFAWYSEHLSMFLAPHGSVPNAQAGLGLPIVYDEETFQIMRGKLELLRETLGCPMLMENGSIFAPVPDMDMTETEFLNRLYKEVNCGTLLDIHNLYVTWRNGGLSPSEYIARLNPDAVFEIHLAGGDELAGFYMDSHSRLTPADVWSSAYEFISKFKNLRAIMFEFHESYYERLGNKGIAEELERLHQLAEAVPQPV